MTAFSTNVNQPICEKRAIAAEILIEIPWKMRALGSLDRLPCESKKVANILQVLLFGRLTC